LKSSLGILVFSLIFLLLINLGSFKELVDNKKIT